MSLVFGLFYMDDETSRHTHFDNPQPILGLPAPSMLDFKHDKMNTESEAYFADGTFDLSDTTRLSLGIRRTTDEFTSKQDNIILWWICTQYTSCSGSVTSNFLAYISDFGDDDSNFRK